MRLIVMFDLEMTTPIQVRNYNKFRNNLLNSGFFMFQYSIYVKPCINNHELSRYENKVKLFSPEGNIVTLAITENQWQSMNFVRKDRIIENHFEYIVEI